MHLIKKIIHFRGWSKLILPYNFLFLVSLSVGFWGNYLFAKNVKDETFLQNIEDDEVNSHMEKESIPKENIFEEKNDSNEHLNSEDIDDQFEENVDESKKTIKDREVDSKSKKIKPKKDKKSKIKKNKLSKKKKKIKKKRKKSKARAEIVAPEATTKFKLRAVGEYKSFDPVNDVAYGAGAVGVGPKLKFMGLPLYKTKYHLFTWYTNFDAYFVSGRADLSENTEYSIFRQLRWGLGLRYKNEKFKFVFDNHHRENRLAKTSYDNKIESVSEYFLTPEWSLYYMFKHDYVYNLNPKEPRFVSRRHQASITTYRVKGIRLQATLGHYSDGKENTPFVEGHILGFLFESFAIYFAPKYYTAAKKAEYELAFDWY